MSRDVSACWFEVFTPAKSSVDRVLVRGGGIPPGGVVEYNFIARAVLERGAIRQTKPGVT